MLKNQTFKNKLKKFYKRATGRLYASPSVVSKAELIFYANYIEEGMIVFDVGANVGQMSLIFSRLAGNSGKVYAFEPAEDNFEKLSSICQIAGCANVSLNHLALSDRAGFLTLHVYDEQHSTWNSLADRPLQDYGIDIKPIRQESVSSLTVDEFCEEREIEKIDLLKIDVEGAEYQVLLGAQKMLSSQKIGCCLFEFGATTFDMGNHPDQIEKYLNGLGYRIDNIVSGNPIFPGRSSAREAAFSLLVARPKK